MLRSNLVKFDPALLAKMIAEEKFVNKNYGRMLSGNITTPHKDQHLMVLLGIRDDPTHRFVLLDVYFRIGIVQMSYWKWRRIILLSRTLHMVCLLLLRNRCFLCIPPHFPVLFGVSTQSMAEISSTVGIQRPEDDLF